MGSVRRLHRAAVTLAAAALVVLTGCTSAGVGQDVDTGYVSGDGNVQEFPVGDRSEPITFGGDLVDGGTWSSDEARGQIVLVNFWYASCAPCRAEAPILASLQEEFADDVTFIGVNLRDSAPAAAAFEESFGIEYPSLLDEETGAAQLAFAGQVAPNAVPSTIVLDAEGRVAARITGAVSNDSILQTLLQDELERS